MRLFLKNQIRNGNWDERVILSDKHQFVPVELLSLLGGFEQASNLHEKLTSTEKLGKWSTPKQGWIHSFFF